MCLAFLSGRSWADEIDFNSRRHNEQKIVRGADGVSENSFFYLYFECFKCRCVLNFCEAFEQSLKLDKSLRIVFT